MVPSSVKNFPVDINLKYAAVENGNFDVTVVYTTDGLNRKANLKVLEDDQNFFRVQYVLEVGSRICQLIVQAFPYQQSAVVFREEVLIVLQPDVGCEYVPGAHPGRSQLRYYELL